MAMSGPELLRWETLTKKQFDEIDREQAVVVVTCSPLEVHGPHLPLGADLLEGEGLMEHCLGSLPERHHQRTFLKLPFVYTACDPVPQAGSVGFRPSTIIAVIEDLGRSLAAQGFRNVLVSNFHGSPRHFLAIEVACDRVSRATGIKMVCIFSAMLTRLGVEGSELGDVLGHHEGVEVEDFDSDTHAGLVETSQLLALHPEWVDPDFKNLPRRCVDLWLGEQGRQRPAARGDGITAVPAMAGRFKESLQYFVTETYSGDPAKASRELGERFLGTLGEKGAEVIGELLDGELPEAEWHSPAWKLRHVFVNPSAVRFFDWVLQVPKAVG
jgi:creatinine amidohydrolase/Fe(II)-dependent formamide hydrolase-like protein